MPGSPVKLISATFEQQDVLEMTIGMVVKARGFPDRILRIGRTFCGLKGAFD